MPPSQFTIEVAHQDKPLTVSLLMEALEETLKILQGIQEQMTAEGSAMEWEIVKISMHSPLKITLAPQSENGQKRLGAKVIGAYFDGLHSLEMRADIPAYFDEDSLEATRKLARLSDEGVILKMRADKKEIIEPTMFIATNIDNILAREPKGYYDITTFEGKLEIINTHGKNSVFIWEPVTDNRIECLLENEEQLQQAKDYLRKRVAIHGKAKYNRKGKPVSMEVSTIRPLRDSSELPQPGSIGRINITNGMSSEDYIRSLRDGGP